MLDLWLSGALDINSGEPTSALVGGTAGASTSSVSWPEGLEEDLSGF